MVTIKFMGRNYTFSKFVETVSQVLYFEFLVPIATIPSRVIFGNFLGYKNNILPLLRISFNKLLRIGDVCEDSRSQGVATQLHEMGYLNIRAAPQNRTGGLSVPDMKTIVAKYNHFIVENGSALAGLGGKILYINKPLEKIPELADLVTPEIDHIVRAYYASDYRIKSVRAWRNYHVPHTDSQKDVGLSNAFHNDGLPRTDLRLFVLLCDGVTRDTGATRFHDKPKSRKLALDPGFFSRRWQTARVKRRLLDSNSIKFFEGNIGDSCLINTQECIHASSIPSPGTFRDIVAFEIIPTNRPTKLEQIFTEMPEDDQINSKLMAYKSE